MKLVVGIVSTKIKQRIKRKRESRDLISIDDKHQTRRMPMPLAPVQ